MSISIQCPTCDRPLRTQDDRAGRRLKCPGCGTVIMVPDVAPIGNSPSLKRPRHPELVKPDGAINGLPGAIREGRTRPSVHGTPAHADSDSDPAKAIRANLPTLARAPAAPAEIPATRFRRYLRWGLSVLGALILGAIGFGTAEMGFYRQTEWSVNYSASGEQISKTGNGTFKFYGIELLNSDDLDSFKRKSNVIGMLIIGTASVGSGLIGGTLAFMALRRLAWSKGDLG